MIIVCPRCNRSISVADHIGDFVHDCNSGNDAIDNEDVKVIGKWEDYSGSGGQATAVHNGHENKIFGTKADHLGAEPVHEVTQRGNTKSTHRTRQHKEYIEFN